MFMLAQDLTPFPRLHYSAAGYLVVVFFLLYSEGGSRTSLLYNVPGKSIPLLRWRRGEGRDAALIRFDSGEPRDDPYLLVA